MTLHDVSLGHEAAADFSLLLAEAARVLSEMASAPPKERAEEFATLQEIHAEGTEFVSMPGIPSSLRGLFTSILTLGARIAASTTALPEATLAQVHVIDSLAAAIANALDETGDVSGHVDAINRSVAALTMSTPTTRDLAQATNTARHALEQFVAGWSH